MNSTPVAIKASGASISIENTTVIGHADFVIETPGVHLVVGRNGAGKTSLLRAIAGQLPSQGITVDDQVPFDNPAALDHSVLMGGDIQFPPLWTVRTVIDIAASRWSAFSIPAAEELLSNFGVRHDTNIKALSRGASSALQATIALASGCAITLLDEPYLGLDDNNRELLYAAIGDIATSTSRTILLATHEPQAALTVASSVITIANQGVQGPTPVGELMERFVAVEGSSSPMRELAGQVSRRWRERSFTAGTRFITTTTELGERELPAGIRVRTAELAEITAALLDGASPTET